MYEMEESYPYGDGLLKENIMDFSYSFTPAQVKRLAEWEAEQDQEWVKSNKPGRSFDGKAYYGAIDGALTYMFTQTGIGTIVKVKHIAGTVIDLTDYDMW